MKQIALALSALLVFASCSNNSDSTSDSTDTGIKSAPITPGIDNVNGNVPDTTGTLRLEQPLPVDSASGTDSARNQPPRR